MIKGKSLLYFALWGLVVSGATTASGHPKSSEELVRICRTVPEIWSGVPVDTDLPPYKACRRLIERGEATADTFYYIGRSIAYQYHGVWDEVVNYFKEADVLGNTKATVALGYLVDEGRISERVTGEGAEALYRRAAQKGDPVGQIMLADWLMFPGMHPPQPEAESLPLPSKEEVREARAWIKKAMAQDFAPAYYLYAIMYGRNKDNSWPETEPQSPVQLLHKAAQGGVGEAIEMLGYMGEDTTRYQDVKIRYPYASDGGLVFGRP